MDATGAGGALAIVTPAEPETPSTVALIVAVPWLTPVTSPDDDTVATVGLLLDHCATRPASVPPAASVPLIVSCVVRPTMSCKVDGCTTTDVTGTVVTVNALDPVTPSVDALMVAVP